MPRPSLFAHRKFLRLVHMLGLPEPWVLGHLEYLWRVGYNTGDPVIGDDLDVEIAAMWTGERGAFTAALVTVRLLDVLEDGTYRIHDFLDHAPTWIKVRIYKRQWRAMGLGDPSGWVATRIRVLTRDEWRCCYCGVDANTVDHVVPKVQGGTHLDRNLVAACKPCNSSKSGRTPEEAGLTMRWRPV